MPKNDKPIYARVNYLINAKFIKSVRISEYDIHQSNISILKASGVIEDKDYLRLSSLPKYDREKAIGIMIRSDPSIDSLIKDGVVEYKRRLFEENHITDDEVIRIANDAVYIMRGSPLQYTDFGDVKFIHKNTYSLFARVLTLTFFFKSFLDDMDLDVLGLGQEQILLHEDYMLRFIGNLFGLIESSTVSNTMQYFMDFYEQYLNRSLPIQFYRELNPNSLYCVRSQKNGVVYGATECDDVSILEIGYNAQILRELYGFIADINERNF